MFRGPFWTILLLSAAQTAAAASLTTIRQLLDLSDADYRRHLPFTVSGTVTATARPTIFVSDETGSLNFICHSPDLPSPGDKVAISALTGTNDNRWNGLNLPPDAVTILGHGEAPSPVRTSLREVAAGAADNRTTVVTNCLLDEVFRDDIDVRWLHVSLRQGHQRIFAVLPGEKDNLARLRSLVGARVNAGGVCLHNRAGRRQFVGRLLMIDALADLEILSPPPEDPFDAEPLGRFASDDPEKVVVPTRKSAAGTVLATWHGDRLLLRLDPHRLVRVNLAAGEQLPRVGDRVQVVGFIQTDLFTLRFARARIRLLSHGALPADPAPDTDPRTILQDPAGHPQMSWRHFGKPIRLTGTLVNRTTFGVDAPRILLDCGNGLLVSAEASSCPEAVDSIALGSRLAVSGICFFETDVWGPHEPFPSVRDFQLIVRTPDDVRVLASPPWWTVPRLMGVTAALFVCLLGFLVWNHLLRRYSERRARQLVRERIDHRKAEFKVEERTHLAVELHDALSQTLTGVALQIDAALRTDRQRAPASQNYLARAQRMLASCRQELRCCLWDLRSRTFEERSMAEAIQRTLEPYADDAEIRIRFNVPRADLSETTVHSVLRIIRELVINAIRHGHAAHVDVTGSRDGDTIRFSVRDDGCGFDPATAPDPAQGHFGLQGIRERLDAFAGTLDLASSRGAGTTAVVRMNTTRELPEK